MTKDLRSLSIEELRDLADAQILTVGRTRDDPAVDYYDDLEQYAAALRRVGKDPDISIPHERAHGECALAVGVIAIKYGIEHDVFEYDGQSYRVPRRAVTSFVGPSKIPRLAKAAISAAPDNPSLSDLAHMKRLGYRDVEHLTERIEKWNRQDNGLVIPMPGTLEHTF